MKPVCHTSIRIHVIKLLCVAGLAIMAAHQPAVAQEPEDYRHRRQSCGRPLVGQIGRGP